MRSSCPCWTGNRAPAYAPYPFNRVDEEFRVEFGGDAINR